MSADAEGRAARPLDVSREPAIFQAVFEILAEIGYDRLTMDAVASRARAGKATLYRRWGCKADLVVDTLQRIKAGTAGTSGNGGTGPVACGPDGTAALVEYVDTGSLRGDLISLCCGPADSADEQTMSVMCGLLTAMRHDRELARAVEDHFIRSWGAALVHAFTLAKQRGEIRADTDPELFARVISGVVFFRLLTGGDLIDPADTARIIDEVVLPAVAVRLML